MCSAGRAGRASTSTGGVCLSWGTRLAWRARTRSPSTPAAAGLSRRGGAEITIIASVSSSTESAWAANVWRDAERIPVLPEGAALCREFGLDPLGTIASGALLVALAPADAGVLLHALARDGIDAAFIGRVVGRDAGVVLARDGASLPMPRFEQDELTRLLA